MPALKPTDFTARVVWLGVQRRAVGEDLVIHGEPLAEMALTFAGFSDEVHAGATRPACTRVRDQHPRGTPIRNVRQLSIVSAEDMAAVAAEIGLAAIDYAWVGASLVIEGIPDFTHAPPSSRLQGPDGVTLVIDMENRPCQEPAVTIAKAGHPEGKRFRAAAQNRRGVTAWVEREGRLRLGDVLRLHIPDQPVWPHLALARGLD
jgi:MOSC domain-containing protein YiiM